MDDRAVVGCLLGTAVGDALGLPYEGLSARRGARLFPDSSRHNLIFGRGMVSDDTEHACFVALSLISADGDPAAFQRLLARRLRWWLLGLPAGVGLATLRSIFKLWIGFSPSGSGVNSAGNGAAMRSAIIGVAYGHDAKKLTSFVRASTELTHSDPRAYYAALAVALAAHQSAIEPAPSPERFLETFRDLLPNEGAHELHELLQRAAESAADNEPVSVFASGIGSRNGISGYCYHTVPCVLQVWFANPLDYSRGLQTIIEAGGDTDTAGAIFGGISGARVGKAGIPEAWRANIAEWPRSIAWTERLGQALAGSARSEGSRCPRYFTPGVPLRNLLFLAIVLLHGLRRALPPW